MFSSLCDSDEVDGQKNDFGDLENGNERVGFGRTVLRGLVGDLFSLKKGIWKGIVLANRMSSFLLAGF